MKEFSHLDKQGRVKMVDVSKKDITTRTARARALVILPVEVLEKINSGVWTTEKGAVFQVAVMAGILAAKKTGDLIPLCHPLGLDH